MVIPDLINGLFEITSGILFSLNIIKLYKDKRVMGTSLIPVAFFTLWGFWNLYYYPYLNQILSLLGGIVIAVMNTIWLSMAIYYKRKEKKIKCVTQLDREGQNGK
jgi:uncharacterized membrane protein YfcA